MIFANTANPMRTPYRKQVGLHNNIAKRSSVYRKLDYITSYLYIVAGIIVCVFVSRRDSNGNLPWYENKFSLTSV